MVDEETILIAWITCCTGYQCLSTWILENVISYWVPIIAVSNKAPKVTPVVHISLVIIIACTPELTITNGSSTAPTYIRFVYRIDNLLIGHGNTNGLWSPIFILILKNNGVWVWSRIKHASYHQVSHCINFPPGFTQFVTGNTSKSLPVPSLMWSAATLQKRKEV